MHIQADDDGHVRADARPQAAQQLAFAVLMRIRDHGAMQIQIDAVDGAGSFDAAADDLAQAIEGVVADMGAGFGRRPGDRHQIGAASRGNESADGNVQRRKYLQDIRAPGQFRPAISDLEIMEGGAEGRESVGLVLEAGDGNAGSFAHGLRRFK